MGASASMLEQLTPEQQAEINAEVERLKGEGVSEEDIDTQLKAKYESLLAAPAAKKPIKIIISGAPASGKGKNYF